MTVGDVQKNRLSREEAERFEEDGLIIVDDPCPSEAIQDVLDDITPVQRDPSHPWKDREDGRVLFTRYEHRPKDYYWDRVTNAWVFSEPVRRLALHSNVLALIEGLYGARPLPFQTLNFPVGTEQAVHFDAMAFESDPPGRMCGVWIALEDIDMDNGPLVYYPGSHKLVSSSADDVEAMLGRPLSRRDAFSSNPEYAQERWREYAEYCQRLIERHGLEPRYGTVRKGQAVIWAANILHGGSPVTDNSRTRHSQVTHYFFEGADRVYTPTRTEGDHIFWDYPPWIRDPLPEYSVGLLHDTIRQHVPTGAKVLIATTGEEDDVLLVEGLETSHFPGVFCGWQDDPIGAVRVEELERRRVDGAQYIVFPRTELGGLQNSFPSFQQHLEDSYRGLLRDGYVCAIYALDQ